MAKTVKIADYLFERLRQHTQQMDTRINGLGALITTFGVGELSAVNGIASAYTDNVPVIHIVGTPPRTLQESRALMHHTFADGEYRRFAAMHSHITIAQTNLIDSRITPCVILFIGDGSLQMLI